MSLSSFSAQDKVRAGLIGRRWERPDHPNKQFRGDCVDKLYWSTSDVAEMLNVDPSAIRFWEQYFGLEVKKNRKRNRQFVKEDVATFTEIHRLLKVELYTLEGAKRQLAKRSSVDVRGEQA